MKNLAEAYQKYLEILPDSQAASSFRTAFFRYTLPEFGYVIPPRSQNRFHPQDVNLAVEVASGIPVKSNITDKLLVAQRAVIRDSPLSLDSARQQKRHLTKFTNFLSDKGCHKTKSDRKKKSYKNIVQDNSQYEQNRPKKINKRKIRLSLDPSDYPGNIKDNQRHIDRINKEIEEFKKFLSGYQRPPSTKSTIEVNLRLLGWCYLKNNIPLSKISLKTLIEPIDINPDICEFDKLEEYFIAKGQKAQSAKKYAKTVINFLDDYFEGYGVTVSATKSRVITELINVAKYQHRNITDEEEYENYGDISVVRRLQIYRNNLPKKAQKIEEELPKWELIIDVLKEIKHRADRTRGEPRKKDPSGRKLAKTTIASNLQKFIFFGMFTLVPPSRQRVIRELSLGETLKHGIFKNGCFIPASKLKSKNEAKYFIHLQPEDYKTGNAYGEWLAEFPNVKFKDGSHFYDYLNRWIYGGARDLCMGKEAHNSMFVMTRYNKPADEGWVKETFKWIFTTTLKQTLSPHKLRAIYRTYLVNSNASQAQLDSCAFWMRHSPEIAKKVYTKQTLFEKTNPGLEITLKLNSDLLNNDSEL